MNNIETFVYNLVRKNPTLKQLVRNIYQGCFDLLPRKQNYFNSSYSLKENYFFGFHDINPFSIDETKILANHINFDLRMPIQNEGIEVGYFNLSNVKIEEYHKIADSYAWNYHKGCRLQWLDDEHIIFNTAINSKLSSNIINIKTKETKIINYPIDSIFVNQNKCIATSFSYERLERCMPGYGYPYKDNGLIEEEIPKDTGLYIINLKNNTREMLLSIYDIVRITKETDIDNYLHFVTHTAFSPDGQYISFLHRKIPTIGNYMKRKTKLLVYDLKENKLITLPSQNSGSHYVWNDKNQLLASCIIDGQSCHVLFDMSNLNNYQIIAPKQLNSDGHQSFITDNSFITDTYPDKYRMAKIYKTDINSHKVELLLSIYSPKKFQTKDFHCHIACDLHPRVSPSGKFISFDSACTGKRSLYIMKL